MRVSGGMRLALVLFLVMCLGFTWMASPSWAETKCTYCNKPLEDAKNPLKCPHCIKLATAIKKRNKKVWVLGFKQHKIVRIQIKDDTGTPENYWALPYTITNNDKVAHSFFLDISAHSDRGKKKFVYRDTYIDDVYKEVRKILGMRKQKLLSKVDVSMPPEGKRNKLPEKVDWRALTRRTVKIVTKPDDDPDGVGKIGVDFKPRPGAGRIALPSIQPKQSLKCVAILGPFHAEMDKLVIKIRGLTNHSILKKDAYVAPKGKPHRRVIKEAVLELHYKRPGDEFAHGQDKITFTGRKWTDVKRVLKSDLPSRN